MESKPDIQALVRAAAELIATRESFEFSIGALKVTLGGCGELRDQLALALEASARQFRGERLSLTPMSELDEELTKSSNAVYRESIARCMEQLVAAVRNAA